MVQFLHLRQEFHAHDDEEFKYLQDLITSSTHADVQVRLIPSFSRLGYKADVQVYIYLMGNTSIQSGNLLQLPILTLT